MEAEKSLSEIARTVLASSSDTSPGSLREKAGLLALLNLLGIVESFYGDAQSAHASMGLLRSIASGTGAPAEQPPKEPDLSSSIMSLAGKLLGGGQGQGGLDPALISGLLGAVTALSRARMANHEAAAPKEAENPAPGGEDTSSGDEKSGEPSDDEESEQTGQEASAKPEAPKPPQPSALQQVLGIDPRLITLALNVLADIMKVRNAAAAEKQQTPARSPSPRDGNEQKTEVTVTPDGKTVVIPHAQKQPRERLYHKPGRGIYRQRVQTEKE